MKLDRFKLKEKDVKDSQEKPFRLTSEQRKEFEEHKKAFVVDPETGVTHTELNELQKRVLRREQASRMGSVRSELKTSAARANAKLAIPELKKWNEKQRVEKYGANAEDYIERYMGVPADQLCASDLHYEKNINQTLEQASIEFLKFYMNFESKAFPVPLPKHGRMPFNVR